MAYSPQDFSHILGMDGISDATLENHFKLYQGYVKNTNLLLEKTDALCMEGKGSTPEFAEMRRRLGFEFDGMRLHEYYFGNLKGNGQIDTGSALHQQLAQDFGSFDGWKTDFTATLAMRGVGWAILFHDPMQNRCINTWITLHQDNVLAGLNPLLVVDAWEHAYYLDYQTERPKYIDAVMRNLNWQAAQQRFQQSNQEERGRKAA